MGLENSLLKMFTAANPLVDIVFLHGLTGDPVETWSAEKAEGTEEAKSTEETKIFWPNWLAVDLPNISIYTVNYPASLFYKWANREMDLFERANNILEHMAGLGLGSRPIVFVAHSLGGILAKQILRSAACSSDQDFVAISKSIKLVIFLGTPHTGASLASVIKIIPGSSSHIKLLSNEIGFLEDLNSYYRAFATQNPDLKTAVYYEKFKTKKLLEIVDRHSADPGVAGTQPVPLDKDHINICKPIDKDDVVYIGIRRHLSNLYRISESSISEKDDYTSRSPTDRRDLLEKLIDAGRQEEYGFANENQNKFARKITKLGLYTNPREDHDLLLTEIEARFVFHVYHPLICKKACDQDINSAIQLQVVDPLINTRIGSTVFSSKDVLSAMWYLTEQCYISWDPLPKC